MTEERNNTIQRARGIVDKSIDALIITAAKGGNIDEAKTQLDYFIDKLIKAAKK